MSIKTQGALLALTSLLLQSTFQAVSAQSSFDRSGKDFKYRKRYIVPSSDLSRRIDYQALPGRDALLLPTYIPQYQQPDNSQSPVQPPMNKTGASAANLPKVNRNGLTPPAPPVKSSLLPASLTRDLNKTNSAGHSGTESPHHGAHLSAQRLNIIKTETQGMVAKGHLADAQNMLNGYLRNYPHETALETELAKVSLKRAEAFNKTGSFESAAQQARLAISHGFQSPEVEIIAKQNLDHSLTKLGISPADAGARLELGEKLLSQNRYNEAEVEYKAAAHIKPTTAAYLGAGQAALKQDRESEAKGLFQHALEVDPQSQEALKQLGLVRLKLKDYAGANADLTRALVLDQNDREAAESLIGLWKNQVEQRPGDANSHLGLARAYQVSGDLSAAQAEYKTVVAIDPKHPNLPAARQSFKLALLRQEARKANDMAHSLESQGNLSAAYQKSTDSVELYPGEVSYQNYRHQLAEKLRSQGLPVQAMSGTALAALSLLQQKGEAPPSLNLPTAQAAGLTNQYAAPAPAAPLSTSSGPYAHENMFHPVSTDQQVSSMAGFLASLRNFTAQQQHQISQAETASQNALRSIATGGSGAAEESALAAAPSGIPSGLPSAVPSGLASGSGAPAGLSGLAASALNAAGEKLGSTSQNPQDALKAAALALANTAGMRLTGGSAALAAASTSTSASTSASASATTSAAETAVTTVAKAPEAAAVASNTPPALALSQNAAGLLNNLKAIKKDGLSKTVKGLGQNYLNKTMAHPTSTAAKPTSTSTQAVKAPTPAPSAAPTSFAMAELPPAVEPMNPAAGLNNTAAYGQPSPSPSTSSSSFVSQGNFPGQGNPGPASNYDNQAFAGQGNFMQAAPTDQGQMPPMMQPQMQPMMQQQMQPIGQGGEMNFNQNMPSMGQAMPTSNPGMAAPASAGMMQAVSGSPLHLYLTGVKASKDSVQLKVTLSNDTPSEFKLPGSVKAILRTSGQADQSVKASFDSRSLSAGGSVSGTIKVPGKGLDPGADVIIPASLLSLGPLPDIHLTVPISQRN